MVAEEYAKEIGLDVSKVQEEGTEGFHVIKTDKHRVFGRFYFLATKPVFVPLGHGWKITKNVASQPGKDIVFGFKHNGQKVTLTWEAMSKGDIDHCHGNDAFGGWHNPVVKLVDFTENVSTIKVALDKLVGETDAVRLMMMDADYVPDIISALYWAVD